MAGYPDRAEAERILREAECCNPGPWGDHSRTAAHCAGKIAAAAGLNPEKAWAMGLLHDIGRKFGVFHMPHIYYGYHYMMQLGYPDVARVCLTHSFATADFSTYIGKRDLPEEKQEELLRLLQTRAYDDYDQLIQLCDCLAGNGYVVDMEQRMLDVKKRYGSYPQEKWDNNLRLRRYFEEKTHRDIYELVR